MADPDKPKGDKDEPSETRRSLHGPMVFLGMIGIIAGVMVTFAYAASDGTAFDGLLGAASNNVVTKLDTAQDTAEISAGVGDSTGNGNPESSVTAEGKDDGAVHVNGGGDSQSFVAKEQNKDYDDEDDSGIQAPITADNAKPESQPALSSSRDSDVGETPASNAISDPDSASEKIQQQPITGPDGKTREDTTIPQTTNHPVAQEPDQTIMEVPEPREDIKQQPTREHQAVIRQEPTTTTSPADHDKDEKNRAEERDGGVQASDNKQQPQDGTSDGFNDKDVKGLLGMVHKLVPQLKEKVGNLVPSSTMMIGEQGNNDGENKVKGDGLGEDLGHHHLDGFGIIPKDGKTQEDSDEKKGNSKHDGTGSENSDDGGKRNAQDKIKEHNDNKGNGGSRHGDHNKDKESDNTEIELRLPVGLDNLFGILTFG